MNKKLVFTRKSSPSNPATGYVDSVEIYVPTDQPTYVLTDPNYNKSADFPCSTCPNPYRPTDNKPWDMVYGIVAPGQYKAVCTTNDKFGKCLIMNDGGEMLALLPDSNDKGRFIISEVFVHRGGQLSTDPNWRGSKGCFTLHPDTFDAFIGNFEIDEVLDVVLQNQG